MPGSATTAWLVGQNTFVPQVFDYSLDGTPGPGTITVPTGATQVVLQVFGAGGGGGGGDSGWGRVGGGGGAGGYATRTSTLISTDASKQFTYTLQAGGNPGLDGTSGGATDGDTANATTLVAAAGQGFSFGSYTLTGGGGNGGKAPLNSSTDGALGSGGSGSGGTTNLSGGNGTAGAPGVPGIGGTPQAGTISNTQGEGGTGSSGANDGTAGTAARVYVRFT